MGVWSSLTPGWWPACRSHPKSQKQEVEEEKHLQRHLLLEKLRQPKGVHRQRELQQRELPQENPVQERQEGEKFRLSLQSPRQTHQQRNPLRRKTLCRAVSVGESLQRTGLQHTRRSVQRPHART